MEQFVCLSHAGGLYFCDVICAQRYWQDADSLSAKSFRYVFPDRSLSRIKLCGGHVGQVSSMGKEQPFLSPKAKRE